MWPTYKQAEVLDQPKQEVNGRTRGQSCPGLSALRRSGRNVNNYFTANLGKI